MLKRFHVNNLKSLINVDFEPGDVNLLIGNNNSGKTNLCKALVFVGLTARYELPVAANYAFQGLANISNVYWDSDIVNFIIAAELSVDGVAYSFSYSLDIRTGLDPTRNMPTLEVREERLTIQGGGFSDVVLLENLGGVVRIYNSKASLAGDKDLYIETHAPLNATMLQRLFDYESNKLANSFKAWLQTILYYDLEPELMKTAQKNDLSPFLAPRGENLFAALYTLKNVDERKYRAVMKRAKLFSGMIDVINFMPFQDAITAQIQDEMGNAFYINDLSKGALKYLALCYLVVTQGAMGPGRPFPSLLIIEEPENALYVGALKTLFADMDSVSDKAQIIFTSHSPYFIDLFGKKLENVFVMKSDGKKSTVNRIDAEKARGALETLPLGEQHFRELL